MDYSKQNNEKKRKKEFNRPAAKKRVDTGGCSKQTRHNSTPIQPFRGWHLRRQRKGMAALEGAAGGKND